MLSLHTNSSSLAALNAFDRASSAQSASATRLSTGYRINSSMDDAAGLQIATRLDAQMSGTKVAMRNIQNSISLMQVTDGVLDGMSSMLGRMNELAIQAGDASSSPDDKLAMQAEFNEMYRQVWQAADVAYNGEHLMISRPGETAKFDKPMSFQIGADSSEVMKVDFIDVQNFVGKAFLYEDPTDLVDLLTNHASKAIDDTSRAIEAMASARSIVGAVANRLDSSYRTLSNLLENTTVAHGRITDTDFAAESAQAVTGQMLMQSSSTMLKLADKVKELTLSLLQ